METKRTYYWLWGAIGFLLCLNLLTIGWVVRQTNSVRANRQVPEGVLIRRLNFTPEQVTLYRQSRSQMRRQSRPHEDSLRRFRTALLEQVKQPAVSDAQLDRLLAQVAGQHRQIARLRFRHWQRIRALCTPAQQIRFDQLLGRIGQGMNNPGLRARLRDRPSEKND